MLEFSPFAVSSTNFDFNDASIYELNKMEVVDGKAEEEERTIKFDIEREFDYAGGELDIITDNGISLSFTLLLVVVQANKLIKLVLGR